MAFHSEVTLRSRIPLVRAEMEEALRRALAKTGQTIADRAKANMTPGDFYESGWAQEHTTYEQLTPDEGQVHIAVPYASGPELGTHKMAARPVLLPAVTQTWPATLYGNWGYAVKGLAAGAQVLPPAPPPAPPNPVEDRPDRTQGGGQP